MVVMCNIYSSIAAWKLLKNNNNMLIKLVPKQINEGKVYREDTFRVHSININMHNIPWQK